MARILLSFVGSNDPFGAGRTTGPILSILEHLANQGQLPDRLLLLVTMTHEHIYQLPRGNIERRQQEGMERQAQEVTDEVSRKHRNQVKVECVLLRVNPADLSEVIEVTLAGVHDRVHRSDEVHCNLSSGTQAMSSAMTFLADSGHLPVHGVWQSWNPAMVPPGAVRVRSVDLSSLTERDLLEQALAHLNGMAFDRARDAFKGLDEMTKIPERHAKAQAAVRLMEAYRSWDRAEYDAAMTGFDCAWEAFGRLGARAGIPELGCQREELARLLENRQDGQGSYGEPVETPAILADLYAGLERRVAAGQFLSVPTRARRIYEGLLNYLIYQRGMNPRMPANSRGVNGAALEELAARGQMGNAGATNAARYLKAIARRSDLDARSGWADVLERAAGHGVNQTTAQRLGDLYRGFDAIRNQSADEHGLGGVSEDQANQTREAVEQMMRLMADIEQQSWERHPFGVEAVRRVGRGLRGWFAIG